MHKGLSQNYFVKIIIFMQVKMTMKHNYDKALITVLSRTN